MRLFGSKVCQFTEKELLTFKLFFQAGILLNGMSVLIRMTFR